MTPLTNAIDRALVAAQEALVVASTHDGHRAAMAKGQLAAAVETLRRARQFATATTSGTYSVVDPRERRG